MVTKDFNLKKNVNVTFLIVKKFISILEFCKKNNSLIKFFEITC